MKKSGPTLEETLKQLNPTSFYVSDDGELQFEWYRDKKWIVDISIDADKETLNYASLLGDFKISGSDKTSDERAGKIIAFILTEYMAGEI